MGLEALDQDDEMSQICIYCGIIPEVVLGLSCFPNDLTVLLLLSAGDGGEDICCRLEAEHLTTSDDTDGVFPSDYVDKFLSDLKCFFLEGLVFPRKHMDSR